MVWQLNGTHRLSFLVRILMFRLSIGCLCKKPVHVLACCLSFVNAIWKFFSPFIFCSCFFFWSTSFSGRPAPSTCAGGSRKRPENRAFVIGIVENREGNYSHKSRNDFRLKKEIKHIHTHAHIHTYKQTKLTVNIWKANSVVLKICSTKRWLQVNVTALEQVSKPLFVKKWSI